MTAYSVCRRVYRAVLSDNVRHAVYTATPANIKRLRKRLILMIERTGKHDEIYDGDYYEKYVEPTMKLSAAAIADSIMRAFSPRSVVDVGCGTGVLMQAMREREVQCTGLEYASAAISLCRSRGLDVHQLDIEADPIPDVRADVVVSTEVAEHLPASSADRFVELLCTIARTVVMTAAVPGIGGTDHVNEQPNEYWIEKFAARGLAFDRELTSEWRRSWADRGVAHCFASAVMVFRDA